MRCGEDLLSARNPFSLHIQTVAQTGGVHSSDGSAKPQGCQALTKNIISLIMLQSARTAAGLFFRQGIAQRRQQSERYYESHNVQRCVQSDSTETESINIKPPGSFSPAEVTDSFLFLQARRPREERLNTVVHPSTGNTTGLIIQTFSN